MAGEDEDLSFPRWLWAVIAVVPFALTVGAYVLLKPDASVPRAAPVRSAAAVPSAVTHPAAAPRPGNAGLGLSVSEVVADLPFVTSKPLSRLADTGTGQSVGLGDYVGPLGRLFIGGDPDDVTGLTLIVFLDFKAEDDVRGRRATQIAERLIRNVVPGHADEAVHWFAAATQDAMKKIGDERVAPFGNKRLGVWASFGTDGPMVILKVENRGDDPEE